MYYPKNPRPYTGAFKKRSHRMLERRSGWRMQDLETWSDTNTITHIYMHRYIYIHIQYIYMQTYVYIYIHMYTHTHTSTNEWKTNAFQFNEGYPGSMRFQRFILAIFYFLWWALEGQMQGARIGTGNNQEPNEPTLMMKKHRLENCYKKYIFGE